MKKGDKVKFKVPVIEGKIKERKIIGDDVECLVEYKQGKETHQKWVPESQLEVVK